MTVFKNKQTNKQTFIYNLAVPSAREKQSRLKHWPCLWAAYSMYPAGKSSMRFLSYNNHFFIL